MTRAPRPLNRTERKRLLKEEGALKDCIFCGAPAGSLEDIWPKWMMKFLGCLPETTIVEQNYDREEKVLDRGKRAALTSTELCTLCNNVWMGQIETRAAPLMKRMINGARGALTPEQRITLADWAIKSAMTTDLVHPPGKRFFDRVDRYSLRRAMTGSGEWPYPRCTSVWISASTGTGPVALPLPCFVEKRGGHGQEVSIPFNTFTFAAGYLVIQAVTARLQSERDCATTFGVPRNRNFDDLTAPIFPLRPGVRPFYPPSMFRLNAESDLDDFCIRWTSIPWPRTTTQD